MAFIKKKIITEAAGNPLEVAITQDQATTNIAQQGLLKLVEGEADAINQYDQAIALVEASEDWLQNAALGTLKDIRREEKKHIAQLYTVIKKLPANEKDFEAGEKEALTGKEEQKESITEAVAPNKKYNGSAISDIVAGLTISGETDPDAYEQLAELQLIFDPERDYTAEEVDAGLARFEIEPTVLEQIEQQISALPDAQQERVTDFQTDMSDDIAALEELLEDNKIVTFAAATRLRELIDGLKQIKYDGSASVEWRLNRQGNPEKTMIA
jgi:rubrerythrin